jgi:arginase
MRSVTLVGVPWDEQSSFMRGAAAAPDAIRRALESPSSNLSTESGLEFGTDALLADAGNVAIPSGDPAAAIEAILSAARRASSGGAPVLALGGDHAVTFPLVRACAERYPDLSILHLDAHPDLYDNFDGSCFSHACPFARIMEARLTARLVQVGIRTLNEPQRRQAERFRVEQIEMRHWTGQADLAFDGPVYVSLDLDVLDPAFAPGVSHHEPGGFSVREVLHIIQRFRGTLVGADVVELNPSRDRDGVTAMVAAKLVKELAARML